MKVLILSGGDDTAARQVATLLHAHNIEPVVVNDVVDIVEHYREDAPIEWGGHKNDVFGENVHERRLLYKMQEIFKPLDIAEDSQPHYMKFNQRSKRSSYKRGRK